MYRAGPAQLEELNIGMDDPAENPEFLQQYLEDSGADANHNGRLDFDEFKVFARYAKIERYDRQTAVRRRASLEEIESKKKRRRSRTSRSSVTPAEQVEMTDRQRKRTAGSGQATGYSKEALEHIRKKKEAKAKEMAEIAARNAAAAREQRKRIEAKKKAAAQRTKKSMDNTDHFKTKAELDKQHEKDRAKHRRSTKEHEKAHARFSAQLNQEVGAVKNKKAVDASQVRPPLLRLGRTLSSFPHHRASPSQWPSRLL